jgi:hypothetical protein
MLHQRGLADACLAGHEDDRCLAGPRGPQEAAQLRCLCLATDQQSAHVTSVHHVTPSAQDLHGACSGNRGWLIARPARAALPGTAALSGTDGMPVLR